MRDETFTLQKILDMKCPDHSDAISQVSVEATQERQLESQLEKIVKRWQDVSFAVTNYKESKDTFILGGLEEVFTALEDSMVTMTTILSSRFVAGIRTEVEKVEKNMNVFSDTLDEWLAVQKNWMYLESIFSAPDIQRQLPNESKQFYGVDKMYRDVMRKTRENDNAMRAATTSGISGKFQKANETLDFIQKNLEEYLETKRMGFPRFISSPTTSCSRFWPRPRTCRPCSRTCPSASMVSSPSTLARTPRAWTSSPCSVRRGSGCSSGKI